MWIFYVSQNRKLFNDDLKMDNEIEIFLICSKIHLTFGITNWILKFMHPNNKHLFVIKGHKKYERASWNISSAGIIARKNKNLKNIWLSWK